MKQKKRDKEKEKAQKQQMQNESVQLQKNHDHRVGASPHETPSQLPIGYVDSFTSGPDYNGTPVNDLPIKPELI